MTVLFSILAAVLIWFSYRSFRGGIDYLRYFRQELAKSPSTYAPFVSVIAPCRGPDEGIERNLGALLEQDYPDYEVIFVVDSEDDPAVDVIRKLSNGRLVVAARSKDSSQKVENLREAVLHTDRRSDAFVFVDSDARPARTWLRHLVAPLEDDQVGAATGYRWFISTRVTFASEMRNMWNASIASALGPNRSSNFCWGGSTAIRRDVFDRLAIRERWRGTLSDDFTVTRAVNDAGLDIYFVPQALTPSIESCTLRELFEFTTRQMKITRVYARNLWLMAFFGSGLFTTVMLTALLIVIFSARNDVQVAVAMLTIVLVTFFSIGKSWLRLSAVRLVLGGYDASLRRQFLPQIALWSLAPALFLYNCGYAWVSRRLTWRGTTYEMVSPNETRIVGPDPDQK
ncbi:MAG TPA: glycosyltransferase family 2 protein [Pyrinomonadaceae bacterium]|nr:glycosyltransferase family 2 protein [Pyrinomonadaceae bacterium]